MPKKTKPNIILITFDDCRADRMGFLGYKKNITPFLDSIAAKGFYFKNAFATGAGSPQSFVGSMTSTYPSDHGGFSYVEPPRVLISEVLQKAGYRTVAVHSAAYLSDYFGYDSGWDVFNYLSPFKDGDVSEGLKSDSLKARFLGKVAGVKRWLNSHIPPLAWFLGFLEKIILVVRKLVKSSRNFTPPFMVAEEINAEVKKILREKSDKPLFLWVHYMEAHELPFFWRSGHGLVKKIKYHLADTFSFVLGDFPKINKLFKNLYLELYDVSIKKVDDGIKDLFSYLQAQGIANNKSVSIFFSDHGEEIFDHGDFGHEQRPFNVNLNIPLIFYSPEKIKPCAEDVPVSLIDIPPTIAALAGARPAGVWKGKDIFTGNGRPVVSQLIDCDGNLTNPRPLGATIIWNGYKFINYKGEKSLFSLDDRKEINNLYSSAPKIASELEKKLKQFMP
ncbi:MAG: sulfatase [Patescibacteria group bacterium]|nr:sulfatase [Patescibacteria group bacterium]MDE2015236.1 sulfatase [Patescibacteria group bacterium]MDE2227042.1 sulfatase [Patescibacteria group bacterium]